ncbi:hypothetical protein LRS10_00930 [Phenylobacterium sp. J426]|uniref:hypothetical protein n=1 Tax=Phenylobacterium sp. J426 TaxID=2898439 RepID=UPI002150BCCB|nr:hypothetical protein [Phenylobacterium sp. J426]MCR5872883.1 hypothetical protein [Phenylobacterium sp. J426]
MFDLSVVAQGGRWILQDDDGEELGRYESRAAALAAALDYARVDEECRVVLVCDDEGEWDEAVVEPPRLH